VKWIGIGILDQRRSSESVFGWSVSDIAGAPPDRRLTCSFATGWGGRGTRLEYAMKKYIIERNIPEVGTFEREQLREAAKKSNSVLKELAPDIQWLESYVAGDRTFCVYLAKDEAIIRKHAEMSGFPATKITEIKRMIDPTTETAA
jgi:hypothetical protein